MTSVLKFKLHVLLPRELILQSPTNKRATAYSAALHDASANFEPATLERPFTLVTPPGCLRGCSGKPAHPGGGSGSTRVVLSADMTSPPTRPQKARRAAKHSWRQLLLIRTGTIDTGSAQISMMLYLLQRNLQGN